MGIFIFFFNLFIQLTLLTVQAIINAIAALPGGANGAATGALG
jgi:hypothetical protein